MLYTGTVDGMSANEGFFELQAENNELLKAELRTQPAIDKIVPEDNKTLVYLKSPLEAAELNQFLFDKKIVLSHLVKRKNSLEEQFLELTK